MTERLPAPRLNIRPYLGRLPVVGERVYIDETSAVIGSVTLGDDVSIWPTTSVRGDVNFITIGARTNVQDGSVLHISRGRPSRPEGWPLIVGADVTIGHRVVLHACTIGRFCLIGMGSIVLDGAVIEDYVYVGAGSVVTPNKRLESGYLYVGSPARRVRPLKPDELEILKHTAAEYVQLKNDFIVRAAS